MLLQNANDNRFMSIFQSNHSERAEQNIIEMIFHYISHHCDTLNVCERVNWVFGTGQVSGTVYVHSVHTTLCDVRYQFTCMGRNTRAGWLCSFWCLSRIGLVCTFAGFWFGMRCNEETSLCRSVSALCLWHALWPFLYAYSSMLMCAFFQFISLDFVLVCALCIVTVVCVLCACAYFSCLLLSPSSASYANANMIYILYLLMLMFMHPYIYLFIYT